MIQERREETVTLELKPDEQVAIFIKRQANNRVTVKVKPSKMCNEKKKKIISIMSTEQS